MGRFRDFIFGPSEEEMQEERVIKDQDYWGRWSRGDDLTASTSLSGVKVTRDTAMQLSAVWGAVTLVADAIASLPLDTYVRREGTRRPFRPRPAWVTEPNNEQTRYAFMQQVAMSLLLPGTAYIYTGRNGTGDVVETLAADPERVTPRREARGIHYDIVGDNGQTVTLGPTEMFHIPARNWPGEIRGISPIESARRVMGSGLAAQEFAERFYGQGLHTAGIVEYPNELTPEQAKELKQDFQNQHSGVRKAHLPAVLTNGAQWKPNIVTPEQAQFLETRKFSVAEIARWFRVPPHLIGDVERSTSWGTGIEEQNIAFVQHTLRPWLELIEQAFTRHLLSAGGEPAFVKFNVDGLLRADFEKRMAGYAVARQWGWMSADEIRAKEDMPPLPDGKGSEYLVPLNHTPSGDTPNEN